MVNSEMTRRGFLQGTAWTLAFPYVITSAALGSSTKLSASECVTLGHIGVGNQGSYLFRQFQGIKGAQSVAVADAYKDRRDQRRPSVAARPMPTSGASWPATTSMP
jgi:glucose-fructose oxidoreductase